MNSPFHRVSFVFRKNTGQLGEDIAAQYLRKRGYRIHGQGVHAGRMGELDIVASKDGIVVFVEVKARRNKSFGLPEEAVSAAKLTKLQRAIHWYRQRKSIEHLPYRLDVIAIEFKDSEPVIRHLQAVGPPC